MLLLIAQMDVDPGSAGPGGSAAAAVAVRLLAEQPDTRWLRWARSTERPDQWLLVAEFESAGSYRRAISPFHVRSVVIPWLSRAEVRDAKVFEVHVSADGQVIRHPEVTVPEPDR